MPRIPNSWLDAVVYLYPTESDARDGIRSGGTGFLVHVPNDAGPQQLYAVTNSHIVREARSPVLRVNTRDGSFDVLTLTQEQWVDHAGGADLSAAPVGLSSDHHQFESISTALCLRAMDEDPRIGPGTEIFFMGRLGEHEGTARNLPVIRFGNIAMLPHEPIADQRGTTQDSYLVEARSISGFSGSPVFADGSSFYHDNSGVVDFYMKVTIRLLGIDWCHLHRKVPVLEDDGATPVPEGWTVHDNTGMMGVVPAWKLLELLEQFRPQRERR